MAETLKKWPPGGKRSPKDPYPWHDWFDGTIVKLRQGRDYQVGTLSFACVVRGAARRLGVTVMTKVQDKGQSLVVQALTKEKS